MDEDALRKQFARAKGEHLEALLRSTSLTHYEVRVGATMGLYSNFERFCETRTLICWTSQELIASITGTTTPGVRKATRRLGDGGFLVVSRAGGGRGRSTEYTLTLPHAGDMQDALSLHDKTGFAVQGLARKPSTTVPKTVNHGSEKPCTGTPTNLLKGISEHTQSARGLTAWDELLAILPERMVKISNLKRAQASWGPKVGAFGAVQLLDAARAYAADPAIAKQNHLPSVQTWLGEGLFEQFLGACTARQPGSHSFAWPGPPEIRAALVEPAGEAFAGSYLDPASWDGDVRQIRPRTSTARQALLRHRLVWAKVGVTIGEILPLTERVLL